MAFYRFEERLRKRDFTPDEESGVICRWQNGKSGLLLDVMPTDATILGFANRWQAASVPFAISRRLPSSREIRAVPPPYLLATKLEAFRGRGQGDFLGSVDFADVIALVDGRSEIVDEVAAADSELRDYLSDELGRMASEARFRDGVFGALAPDEASQRRGDEVLVPRLEAIAGKPLGKDSDGR